MTFSARLGQVKRAFQRVQEVEATRSLARSFHEQHKATQHASLGALDDELGYGAKLEQLLEQNEEFWTDRSAFGNVRFSQDDLKMKIGETNKERFEKNLERDKIARSAKAFAELARKQEIEAWKQVSQSIVQLFIPGFSAKHDN